MNEEDHDNFADCSSNNWLPLQRPGKKNVGSLFYNQPFGENCVKIAPVNPKIICLKRSLKMIYQGCTPTSLVNSGDAGLKFINQFSHDVARSDHCDVLIRFGIPQR